jgi:hypothetical protein
MNDLERYCRERTDRLIHQWEHYFEIYDRHLSRFRDRPVNVVEIGVLEGGSLRMWKEYFGPESHIFGIDVDPACRAFAEDGIDVLIGDQADRGFLTSVREAIPVMDVLIDDGGHTMEQQITTFEELYPHVAPEGVFLCEDLHTSYHEEFGGGYREPRSFIERSKHLIDALNAWHARPPRRRWFGRRRPELPVSDFTRSTDSLHYYDSVLVIEKRPRSRPVDVMFGGDGSDPYDPS